MSETPLRTLARDSPSSYDARACPGDSTTRVSASSKAVHRRELSSRFGLVRAKENGRQLPAPVTHWDREGEGAELDDATRVDPRRRRDPGERAIPSALVTDTVVASEELTPASEAPALNDSLAELAGPLDDTVISSPEQDLGDAELARPLRRELAGETRSETAVKTRIGRLRILRTLGAGGMGVVHAAYDPNLDREVAVKLIRGGQDNAAARLRLEREAQALAKLAHPNIVSVFDVDTHDGQIWVSMEFVHGRTLRVWLEQERPGWRQVLSVIQQAGRGIAAAHAEGLLHRDIKPDNIMVTLNTALAC